MFITALDIGSSQIKAVVAEVKKDSKLSLIASLKSPSFGLRRGEAVSPDDAAKAICGVLGEIKQSGKNALKNIFVNVGGGNVKLQTSRGIVAVSRADSEIYKEDVERVIKASQAINIGPNRMILHTLTKEFIVDDASGILDPLGMIGNRLEVESLIVDAFKSNINNLIKCVEAGDGKIMGLIYSPLAASRAVLSKTQKDLGAAIIDIGFGTTDVCVYEEDGLLYSNTFGVGSGHITNDLAIGLRLSVKAAEAIKLTYGFALAREVSGKERVELNQINGGIDGVAQRRFIAEIIEVRLEEIFEMVNSGLKSIGRVGKLPAGAVLVGGGAKMPGIVELAKKELKLPVQIGIPEVPFLEIKDKKERDKLEDPEWAVAAGLLIWGSDEALKSKSWLQPRGGGKLAKIFRYFLP